MAMQLDILAVVVLTATIQSLLGVGVLLLGTPILLLLGYPFVTALAVLLPISLSISLLQVSRHYACIDPQFYKKVLSWSVPCVVLSLFLVTRTVTNIGVIVGLFLIIVSLKNVSERMNRFIASMVRYERTYFLAMGIVHGLTNLGGALLAAIVHGKNYAKDAARATTAASYATFVVFQLLTLFVALESFPVSFSETAAYVLAGVVIFLVTEKVVYAKINTDKYRVIFAVFLFVSGVVLIGKALLAS